MLALVAIPWAVFTSAFEWFVLVPLFPFWQPIALSAVYNRELPWLGRDQETDQTFMRHMSTHHEQGIELASIAAEKAASLHLQSLAKLMAASQSGEKKILENWWTSWFGLPMQICSAQERASMLGLLGDAQIAQLRATVPAAGFDALFVRFMTVHHTGAVKMADEGLRNGNDPHLRVMAQAIHHEQQGEIALMNCVRGETAVRLAVSNMFADNVNKTNEARSGRASCQP
jgi:uncharacterized protein (DUF305 family)